MPRRESPQTPEPPFQLWEDLFVRAIALRHQGRHYAVIPRQEEAAWVLR